VNLEDVLRNDFGCSESTIRDVLKWAEMMPDRDKTILEKRLEGKSMRWISRELGITHPTVSSTIRSWTELKESLEDATERLW
jgi:DNA-binding NarL/FixJ family response regulator